MNGVNFSVRRETVRGVPYVHKVRSMEDARKYGVGPANLVPFKETEYEVLREPSLEVDPALWAHTVSAWDNRLFPAVAEAQRLEEIVKGNAQIRFAAAEKHNAPILARLGALVDEEAELRTQMRAILAQSSQSAVEKVENLAQALGEIGIELPENLSLEVPDKRLLHSEAAHAAELQLPHDPEEAKHFLKGWQYWAATGVTGCLFGISAFSIPGMVHPAALAKDPPWLILFAMTSGVGFTTLAGKAMRLNFRYAAESYYYAKKRWFGALCTALSTNLVLASLYTIVDAIGLMKSRGVLAQVASLSGATQTATSIDPAYIVAAGAFSLTYTAYSSISGWMEARKSAANRITKASEDERIAALVELKAQDDYSEAITALNALRADDLAAKQIDAIQRRVSEHFASERESLNSQLIVAVECTDEEGLLLERARTEAEGRQAEFDRLVMQLRDELLAERGFLTGSATPNAGSRNIPARGRLGSWLRNAISRLSGSGEQAA